MRLIKNIKNLKTVFPKELTNEFINSMPRRILTVEEKSLPYAKYYYKDMAKVPSKVLDSINKGPVKRENVITIHEIDLLLSEGYLTVENGYCYMGDGTGFAASKVFMKDVSLDMLDWWFNWHVLHSLRYAIWCPVAHNGIKAKTPHAHLDSSDVELKTRNYNKVHYPDEGFNLLGHEVVKIEFIDPKLLGLDIKNTRAYIANVSKMIGFVKIPVTSFIHVARPLSNGVEFRSRYFPQMRITKKGKFKKSKFKLNKDIVLCLAKNNCFHSLIEYNNLAEILPKLYEEMEGRIV